MRLLDWYVIVRELAIIWAIWNLMADVVWGAIGAARTIRRQIKWLRGWLHV